MTPIVGIAGAMVLLAGALMDASGSRDACFVTVPASLRAAVKAQFPKHRLPRRADNLVEDIEYYKQRGHGDCLGVTRGDFNGDGRADYGVLLTSLDESDAILLAALRAAGGWRLDTLRGFSKAERGNLYVVTASPGEYKNPRYVGGGHEPGEVKSFRSARQGIVTGTTESSAVSYFWTPKGWVHVWVMD